MIQNRSLRVVTLISICFSLYIITSFLSIYFNYRWTPFDRINLVSDIFKNNKKSTGGEKNDSKKIHEKNAVRNSSSKKFELYKNPDQIISFYDGNSGAALPHFAKKLNLLKSGKKTKIRIAYFGDSMIEGDLLTQTLRRLLQKEFGGSGVGFLSMQTNVGGFRRTATVKGSNWKVVNFMDKGAKNMYISGFTFHGNGTTAFSEHTAAPNTLLQKHLLYGNAGSTSVTYNGATMPLSKGKLVNKTLLASDNSNIFTLKNNSAELPVYGVSFESENGIILDNFSFRGITGVEFRKIDEDFLKSVQEANHYDLIVLQYGVNLLWKPDTKDFSFYSKGMKPILEKFNRAFPQTDIMMVSSADRAFMYNGAYQTATGIPNVLEAQAKLAYDNNLSFFNLFETMGGENSIVKWASQSPPLANKDYIHPNEKGTDFLAKKIYNAILQDLKKYKPNTGTAR